MLNHKKKSKMFKRFRFKEKEPEIEIWEIDDEFHDKLSTDVLKRIYTEAEIRLNDTIDNLAQLKGRAYSLITIFISLFSILITLYFGDYFELHIDKRALILLYFINLLTIAYVIVQLVRIVFPNYIMLKGEEPKRMNYEVMANLSCKEQSNIYLFNSISRIQIKIDYNEKIINRKTQIFENMIFISIVLFILTLIIELILKLY
jgi:hypothetical protein